MDRKLASILVRTYLAISEQLNIATLVVGELENESEQRVTRMSIGNILALIQRDLIVPVIQKYPDLDPDKKWDS